MAEIVLVACRLPHGLHLDLADFNAATQRYIRKNRVTLRGAARASIAGAPGITPVPAEHWSEWKKRYADHPAFKSGAIFVTKNESDALLEGRSRESEKTGFEQAKPTDVKSADPSKQIKPEPVGG